MKLRHYSHKPIDALSNAPEIAGSLMTSDIEKAYGLLWRSLTDDPKVHEARKILLSLVDKNGQRRGIKYAYNKYGPLTEHELLHSNMP